MTPIVITSISQPLHKAYLGACLNGWMAISSQDEAEKPQYSTRDQMLRCAWIQWSRAQRQGLVVQ